MRKRKKKVTIQDLEYADDMTLMSDSMEVLEEILRTLHTICSGMGLSIISKKSIILGVCPSNSTSTAVQQKPGEEPMVVLEVFQYFGRIISRLLAILRN